MPNGEQTGGQHLITKFGSHTKGISQHGTYWCIPASIENLLRSEGVFDISQELLVYEYLIRERPIVERGNDGVVDLRTLKRYEVLETYRCSGLPDASFQTFSPLTNEILSEKGGSLKLSVISDIGSGSDYIQQIITILAKNKPVLISASHRDGWHITIVYEYDGVRLWSYDPGRDQHLVESISDYKFSHDLLFVD